MEDNQIIPTSPDFSDIPSLGDVSGLETYLNNQALAAQGLPVEQPTATQQAASTEQSAAQPAAQPAAAPAATTAPAAQASGTGTINLTQEQLAAIIASRNGGQSVQQPVQQPTTQQQSTGYSAQEQQFIVKALAQGYSLTQINDFLVKQKTTPANNPVLEQRIAQVEQYLKTQEYKQAETAFISRLSDFGNKWGLSEQDLVTFGQEALNHGINIAVGNVDLEMVFRAVYPQQYAIRSQRMTPTNSSQIYGGTSIPEGSRASASKLEDAYVDNFLKGAMPTQYSMLNKK